MVVGGKRIEVGETHGELTILSRLPGKHFGNSRYEARCSCDSLMVVTSLTFRRRVTCVQCSQKRGATLRTTHGGSKRGQAEPLLIVWKGMRTRCTNPNSRAYKWYGGRGVTVCKEWAKDYAAFRAWGLENGYRKGLTLERRRTSEGYSPDNCEWVSQRENSLRMLRDYRWVKRGPFDRLMSAAFAWAVDLYPNEAICNELRQAIVELPEPSGERPVRNLQRVSTRVIASCQAAGLP